MVYVERLDASQPLMQKCLWPPSVKLWTQLMGETVIRPTKTGKCGHDKCSCATQHTCWLCFHVQQESVHNSGLPDSFVAVDYFIRNDFMATEALIKTLTDHAERGVALIQYCKVWTLHMWRSAASYWAEQREVSRCQKVNTAQETINWACHHLTNHCYSYCTVCSMNESSSQQSDSAFM